MTKKQSTARLVLYCLAAFITPIAGNWAQMADATPHQWAGMILQAAVATIIAARAYIDQSPTEVNKP
jgi:hypothetical protein